MDKMVSVIMPAYNAEKWIEDAIVGVLVQTYQNFELIVINDGSTDDTEAICKRLMQRDKRIRLFSQENKGLCSARNQGLQLSRGDYFIIIDSDDLLEPTALEKLVKVAEGKGAEIVIAGYWVEEQRTNKKALRSAGVNFDFVPGGSINTQEVEKLILSYTIAPTWNKLYAIRFTQKRFDTSLAINEDVLFSLETIKAATRVAVIAEPTYHYILQNSNSLSSRFHPELPHSLDKIVSVISNGQQKKLRPEIARWLLDYWFVYIRQLCQNVALSEKEKLSYLELAQKTKVFQHYGNFRYCNSTRRKVSLLFMKAGLNVLCVRWLTRKEK